MPYAIVQKTLEPPSFAQLKVAFRALGVLYVVASAAVAGVDPLHALVAAVVGWLVLAVIACFVNRRWVREFVMWLLGGLFLAVLAYALFTDDAVIGIAVSGIALILWLWIKSESTEPGSREE